MRKTALVTCAIFTIIFFANVGFQNAHRGILTTSDSYADSLRALYVQPANLWPVPNVDSGILWDELGVLPESPLKPYEDSLKHLINLGKLLFFDHRISGSEQISCASCHIPDLSWADGREKAVGHSQSTGKRNTPSLLNIWYFKTFFWDGRSKSLEDQAFNPINNPIEMHADIAQLPAKLGAIKEYLPLFDSAFGSSTITPERIAVALATFQKTIVSRKSDFDWFLLGEHKILSNQAIKGLHLFRTKARCLNCHYGPMLTDNNFHNLGLTYYQRKYEDLGLYNITHKAADVGKFRTPSLRDVIRTRPWMHNGLFDNIEGVINIYNAGGARPSPKPEQVGDSLYPQTSPILVKLHLSKSEKEDLIAFLTSITSVPWKMRIPQLPK